MTSTLLFLADEIKTDTKTDCCAHTLSDDDAPPVKYADLEEVVVIEENYEDENEAGDLNEPQRLSTVQENEPTIEVSSYILLVLIDLIRARRAEFYLPSRESNCSLPFCS